MSLQPPGPPSQHETQMLYAMRTAAAASLASGIIAATGRPLSMSEAIKIHHDAYFSLYAEPAHGRYQAWKKEFDENRVYT